MTAPMIVVTSLCVVGLTLMMLRLRELDRLDAASEAERVVRAERRRIARAEWRHLTGR